MWRMAASSMPARPARSRFIIMLFAFTRFCCRRRLENYFPVTEYPEKLLAIGLIFTCALLRNNYRRLYNIQFSTISIDPVPDTLHAHVMCKHETSGTLAWTDGNQSEQLSQGVTVSVSKGHQWNCCSLNDKFLNFTFSCKTVQSDIKENVVPSAPSKLSLISARLLVDIYIGKITWILHICSVTTISNQLK